MKKTIIFADAALILAACADTRAHISSDATSWEKVQYSNQQ